MTRATQASETILDLLRMRAAQTPEKLAYEFLTDGDRQTQSLTYGALEQQARTIATALRQSCSPGDRVLILHPPGLSYIAAFYGCLYGGLVAVPAYPPRKNRSVERILSLIRDAQPQVAMTTESILALLKPRIIEFPELRTVQWLLSDRLDYSEASSFEPPSLEPDALAFLQYTSGSTAAPKGVMITHHNILHNISWMQRYVQPQSDSHGVIWLPPYHDMGLISGILAPLCAGTPVTLMSPFHFLQRPLRWLDAISSRQADFSGGPSFAYELCVNKIKVEALENLDLSRWRVAFNGAEPIQSETMERFTAKFSSCGFRADAFHPCYGMAEATLMVTWPHELPRPQMDTFAQTSPRPLVSAGRSLGDQTVMVVDPSTQTPCDDGNEGEVWVSGDSVAQGYWNQEQLTQTTFHAGLGDGKHFLRTGDLGILKDGELFVTGRLKDLLIVNGVNYHPQDLEIVIASSHEAVAPLGAAVVVGPGHKGAETLLACVELNRQHVRARDQFEAIAQAIRRSVSKEFQLVLHQVVLLKPGRLPKTSSGKLQRYLCREKLLDGEFEPLYQHQLLDGQPQATTLQQEA